MLNIGSDNRLSPVKHQTISCAISDLFTIGLMGTNLKMWNLNQMCFLWSAPEQKNDQIIETSVIWNAIALAMASLQCQTPNHLLKAARFPDTKFVVRAARIIFMTTSDATSNLESVSLSNLRHVVIARSVSSTMDTQVQFIDASHQN